MQIFISDWLRVDPIDLGIGLASTLHQLYPQGWKPEGFLKMLADRPAYQAVLDGKRMPEIKAVWTEELREFRETRSKYLLYP